MRVLTYIFRLLQISDLSFRRHVLVQALIIMDFLLSLSAKAKEKLSTARAHNKAVEYLDQKLSDDDVSFLFFPLVSVSFHYTSSFLSIFLLSVPN
jgi:hypothetical protein